MVESREWHCLLAAKSLLSSNHQNSQNKQQSTAAVGEMSYGYWRWHGYLCRYATSSLLQPQSEDTTKTGIVLVHGFGASGSQFGKTISELASTLNDNSSSSSSSSSSNSTGRDTIPQQAMAPDLIGFGHCEKPPITYTQYMWSAFVSDFIHEQTIVNHWNSYYIGGNSIGGYTSMMTAADDDANNHVDADANVDANVDADTDDPTSTSTSSPLWTSSGSVGSGKCKGLILMNSAGRILTPEEEVANDNVVSVAQATINNELGPCK